MKLIRFSFACSRKVAFYAQLCNHYLNYAELSVTIGWIDRRFVLEAEGDQAELERLAASISNDFMVSIWLTDAKMDVVSARIGSRSKLTHADRQLPFCNHCYPLFSDNQSAQFGQLDVECALCHGEHTAPSCITFNELQNSAAQLRETSEASFLVDGHYYHVSLKPFIHGQRQQVLVCNPNRLNDHFAADNQHVLALSSLEKPLVTLRANADHAQLTHTRYDLRFAWNRMLSVFAEILRQQGIDYLFYQTNEAQMQVAWVANQWSEIGSSLDCKLSHHSPMTLPSVPFAMKEPLHDYAIIRGLRADWRKGKVSFNPSEFADTSDRDTHAMCALHAGNVESGILRNSAVIYFSRQAPGQLIALGSRLKTETFFKLRDLPESGDQLLERLIASGRNEVVSRFSAQFANDIEMLTHYQFDGERDNLTTLFAMSAFCLGLAKQGDSTEQLADKVVAAAMRYRGKNAHRVDFAFDESNAELMPISGLDYYPTLASVMAFRLATNGEMDDVPKLAFGIMDSLADYLGSWVEHLDSKYGIKQVVLAGDEMDNECLTQRIAVRVGNNFPLFANRRLMIDGNNLSVGALLLSQRRRR
ncbi:hypothetical protein [Photobacterium nomapromontoriensis]|uniref:hypothetical protein n=1 Tax=Photobacterium nomapromontoriensis TaxID=2910237 RepID=UPI003D0A2A8D